MRRLILFRHAKSDRPANVDDHERPLNPRGRDAAPRMGAYLAAEGLSPDYALVSTAQRTVETWEAARGFVGAPASELVRSIYEASESAIRDAIRAAPDSATCLIVVGHNPGLQDCALRLVKSGDQTARARLKAQFPTAALAVIDFDLESWAGLTWGSGRLERFATPKDIDRDLED